MARDDCPVDFVKGGPTRRVPGGRSSSGSKSAPTSSSSSSPPQGEWRNPAAAISSSSGCNGGGGGGGGSAHARRAALLPALLLALLPALLLAQLPRRAGASSPLMSWRECNAQAVYGGLYGAQAAANLTLFRSRLLSQVWATFDPTVEAHKSGHKRFDALSPFITCPPHQPLTRYGRDGDGGKLLCDMSKLRAPCVIYSLGSNGDYTFELDALNHTRCEVHTFDCTYDGKKLHPRHTYHKTCVGSGDAARFKSWAAITRELGHLRGVDIAKIDIEGHEPPVLAELTHDVPLPRQIVIEMHLRPMNESQDTIMAKATSPRTPAAMALMFLHLASVGYGVTAREDNIWGEPGCCAEFSLLLVEQQWYGLPGLASLLAAAEAGEGAPAKEAVGGLSTFEGLSAASNGGSGHRRHSRPPAQRFYQWMQVLRGGRDGRRRR